MPAVFSAHESLALVAHVAADVDRRFSRGVVWGGSRKSWRDIAAALSADFKRPYTLA